MMIIIIIMNKNNNMMIIIKTMKENIRKMQIRSYKQMLCNVIR